MVGYKDRETTLSEQDNKLKSAIFWGGSVSCAINYFDWGPGKNGRRRGGGGGAGWGTEKSF